MTTTATLLQRLRSSRLRETLASLLAAAFLLTALVPAGYMPAVDGSGLLQLCTAQGARSLPGALPGPLPAPTHDGSADEHPLAGLFCGFAAAPAFTAPPALPQFLALPPRTRVALRAAPSAHHRARDGPARLVSSRGPPLSDLAPLAG